MAPDGPRFLNTPPIKQFKADRSISPIAQKVVEVLAPDAADGTEEGNSFAVRTGAAYMANAWGWDEQPYGGPTVGAKLGPVELEVPAEWGEPDTKHAGALVWSTDDAVIILEARSGWTMTPTPNEWVEVARRSAKENWSVFAGRGVEQAHGRMVEVMQACLATPRAVRVSRWLFAPPVMAALHVNCPDALTDAIGQMLAAASLTLRPR